MVDGGPVSAAAVAAAPGHRADPSGPASPAVPPQRDARAELAASLEVAFAAEVAERLPRLLLAARELQPCDDRLTTALRDAHTLGSSAAVVGQPAASTAARAVEVALVRWQQGDVTALAELPSLVARLHAVLARWLP